MGTFAISEKGKRESITTKCAVPICDWKNSQQSFGQANRKRTTMWNWIASNHQVIGALANIAMLVVWIAYLQVFVSSYRRQKRSNILITRGAGAGLEARCLISNMSAEAIYIESLITTVETTEGRWSCPVTELLEGRSDLQLATRQGPLKPGHLVDIGSFQSLTAPVIQQHMGLKGTVASDDFEKIIALEIKAIAVHGSEELLSGAIRRFDVIRRADQLLLRGHAVGTRQIRSRRERKQLHDDVRADL